MQSYGTPKNIHFHGGCPCCIRNPAPTTRLAGAPSNSNKKRLWRRHYKKRARQANKRMCAED